MGLYPRIRDTLARHLDETNATPPPPLSLPGKIVAGGKLITGSSNRNTYSFHCYRDYSVFDDYQLVLNLTYVQVRRGCLGSCWRPQLMFSK